LSPLPHRPWVWRELEDQQHRGPLRGGRRRGPDQRHPKTRELPEV